jgi:RNA polymerase sigma-70 factor (ECF subfamily)
VSITAADIDTFQAVRPRLFGIAYRMLGTRHEAEEIVQEAWLRWQGTDRAAVREPAAFLATATTRLAINVIQSARARHETHIEPQVVERADTRADPLLDVQRAEALELAVATLLEKLSPAERAVYVLREAFDYPYRSVADVLPLSETNARQLVTRARRRLAGEHRRPVNAVARQRFLEVFRAAATTGELAQLEELLIADMAGEGACVAACTRAASRVRVAA